MKRTLLILHWLNFDTALGAAITSLFIAQKIGSVVPSAAIGALFLSVLAIYNFDHLMDVRNIEDMASSLRHRFYQKHFKVLAIYQTILLVALIALVWFLPPEVAKAGIVLALITLIYFLMLFIVLPNRFILKELSISLVFVCALFLAPLAGGSPFIISLPTILLATQIFLLALANILIFSWFDYDLDTKECHTSLARVLGKKKTYGLSMILLLLFGFTIIIKMVYAPNVITQSILITMGLVLFLTLVKHERVANNEAYRIYGEAIFLLPILALV